MEVSQVGLADADTYYTHIDPISNDDPDVKNKVNVYIT